MLIACSPCTGIACLLGNNCCDFGALATHIRRLIDQAQVQTCNLLAPSKVCFSKASKMALPHYITPYLADDTLPAPLFTWYGAPPLPCGRPFPVKPGSLPASGQEFEVGILLAHFWTRTRLDSAPFDAAVKIIRFNFDRYPYWKFIVHPDTLHQYPGFDRNLYHLWKSNAISQTRTWLDLAGEIEA